MAFCTQRKFPGQTYDHNGLAEIPKMKCYSSIRDHRTWSIDRNQQTSYLVDAVHKCDGNTNNVHQTISNHPNAIKKVSSVGTSAANRNDSSTISQLNAELEKAKQTNLKLQQDNDELRKNIANPMPSDDMYLQIIEKIIAERDELRELLDKFLGVADQIVELKLHADMMKNIECDYLSLQEKFKDHQNELETLRNEKQLLEDQILDLQTTNADTDSLKSTNSKLEKDLYDLSNMISVSDSFIRDQDNEIKTKLQTISELNTEIENLKVALSEAEAKLNKKLRLEMDVEQMEKELSIMIENSADSNPYNQQVIDRQVEDLATAIKLTLGCMNYEFENNEEDNLAEANRQLKTLLLESSNKILEFKDVINKQEQNLMKATNDFACKNDELTECLATVEDLKRQLAQTRTDLPIIRDVGFTPLYSPDDVPNIGMGEEVFESEVNLADSPQVSECEDDGQRIEDLESIFERTCSQQNLRQSDMQLTTELHDLKPYTRLSEEHKLLNKMKLGSMNSPHTDNAPKNAHGSRTTDHRGFVSTTSQQIESDQHSTDVMNIENENLKLKMENERLVVEIGKLKNFENYSHKNISEMEKELEKLTAINDKLAEELAERKLSSANDRVATEPEIKDLVLKNEELRNENEKLLHKIRCFDQADAALAKHSDDPLKSTNQDNEINTEPDWLPSNEDLVAEIEKLQQSKSKSSLTIRQMEKDLKKMESINESLLSQLRDKEAELAHTSKQTDFDYIVQQNEELKAINGNLTVEISDLKNLEQMARAEEIDAKEELEKLAGRYKILADEINELKHTAHTNQSLLSEKDGYHSPQNRSQMSILQIGKDLERLEAINESLLALNDADSEKKLQFPEIAPADIKQILKQNQELKNANENLSSKVRELQKTEDQAHFEAIESKDRIEYLNIANERLQSQINELASNERNVSTDLHPLKIANKNLQLANDKLKDDIALLEEKLRNIENRTSSSLETSTVTGTTTIGTTTTNTTISANDYSMEIDWMVADMKKLQNKNENLRATNEKLLSQISELQSCASRSNSKGDRKLDPETVLDIKESDNQLIYASNRNIEIDWMKVDMDAMQKKNEKLKTTNESLVAEIGMLKEADARTHKNVQQMEKDLLRLSAINERLSNQLNEKRMDKKQLLKVRSQEIDPNNNLLKKIDELTTSNEYLASENAQLKSLDIVKMRNDLKKLSSTNESLKLQISEMKLLSSNDLKMESDWMAADVKRIFNKNKKLSVSNQNLLNEISELRREFRSLENRANMTALQKIKEVERLTSLNETLKEQLDSAKHEKRNPKSFEIGSDASVTDVKKVHKKNDELKAANEKLLSVIINLKNSEKLASSKVTDMEREMNKLRETNKSLQDTLENYVEKDWTKPKTEIERICQLILNDGIYSLTDTEFHYMYKWFGKSLSAEHENPKTSRKHTTRKHCRICNQVVDPFDKICDCKQYEEKKRLNLLKEIEETKLAIQHIQSSNDIEFDLNDVKNRLLKGKPAHQSDDDGQYGVRMSQSQGSVNVRAHIVKSTKRDRRGQK